MSILTKLFSSGTNDLVKSVGGVIDELHTSKEEKLAAELKIKELRAISENKLGDEFDIKEFHHEVLRHGGIPLYVLEENINSWINQQIN